MSRWSPLIRAFRERRRAERDYHKLCDQGRAPQLSIDIHIHPDDCEWSPMGAPGITGVKATIPLTPKGERYIAKVVRDIRATCLRAVLLAERREIESQGVARKG